MEDNQQQQTFGQILGTSIGAGLGSAHEKLKGSYEARKGEYAETYLHTIVGNLLIVGYAIATLVYYYEKDSSKRKKMKDSIDRYGGIAAGAAAMDLVVGITTMRGHAVQAITSSIGSVLAMVYVFITWAYRDGKGSDSLNKFVSEWGSYFIIIYGLFKVGLAIWGWNKDRKAAHSDE